VLKNLDDIKTLKVKENIIKTVGIQRIFISLYIELIRGNLLL